MPPRAVKEEIEIDWVSAGNGWDLSVESETKVVEEVEADVANRNLVPEDCQQFADMTLK